MARPDDWTALQGYNDPVPGDPYGVSMAANRYTAIAEAIDDAEMELVGVFENDELVGEAIDAVREVALDVADRISRAKRRYEGVGKALAGYVSPLEDAQRDSLNLLNTAITARDERHYAEDRLYYWQRELDEAVAANDAAAASTAQLKVDHWQQEIYRTNDVTTIAVNDLQTVLDTRDAAANLAADAIELVENSGGLNDDWLNNLDQWFEENPWINTVITWAGYIAAALAIIAMFIPGLNIIVAIITVIVIVVMVATVVNAVLQAITGNKPWGQALFEIVMAVIPFGVGKGLSGAFGALASKIPATAVTSVIKSGNAVAAGITKPMASTAVAGQIAKGPFSFLAGEAGMLADAAQLAKMPLPSGNLSPLLGGLASEAGNLFGQMVAWEAGPSVIDAVMNVTGFQFGGGDLADLQNHDW
ncbi:MAG TPA: hypothetical protein VNS80_06995 [Pseudolysinimonas sp.]|nr:hypothetical protein [Pseudolysinimonas sp.]